jgi:hypothetical protein
MARDVEADVNINDKSGRGLSSFLAGLRRADQQVKSTQKDIDKASESTSKLGKSADENGKAFHRLSSELGIAKKELGDLARAFANAGSAAERMDITKAMKKQQAEIRNLTKNRDILGDLLPDEGDAKKDVDKVGGVLTRGFAQLSPKLASSLSEAFEGAGTAAGPVLVGAVAASLPILGATVSAAIIGGAGIGGVIGGVLLAAQDSRVQAAFGGMKARIGNQLKDAAIPFISQTIGGIGDIEAALGTINFKNIFAQASTFVRPLTRGIGAALEAIGGGLEKLISGAGPVIGVISRGIAATGQAIAGIFDSLADNGVEAAAALNAAFGLVIGTLKTVGAVINGLTEAFGFLANIGAFGQQVQQQYIAAKVAQDIAAKSAQNGTGSIQNFMQAVTDSGTAAAGSATNIDQLTQSIDDASTAGQGFYDSQTQVGQALADVADKAKHTSKSVKEHGDALDVNTAKGRENRSALNTLAGALTGNYDAYVKLNGAGKGANAVATTNRANFIKAATSFGLSASAAKNLATKLGLIPANKNVHIKTNADQAKDAINGVQKRLNALHDKSIRVAVSTNVASVQRKVENTLARLGGGFDATNYFAPATAGDGLQRSGGPAQVQVDSTVENTIYLDGKPFRAYTTRTVSASADRAAWRQKVGKV